MNSIARYGPILASPHSWPVVKMYQAKEAFLEAVSDKAVQDILSTQSDWVSFRLDLAKNLANEQVRLQKTAWKVDRKIDADRWLAIINDLENTSVELPGVLKEISLHYAREIAGGFNIWHYRLAQATASYTLNRLLNPIRARQPRSLTKIRADLQEQIEIVGAIHELRQLAKMGTIVMVPTHCSHFDSVLVWWVIHTLGLPPFIYGAGLNLYNSPFFGYFMNKLGTYKVDRRKKNIAYLTTLKAYSSMALHWGCHSLFYPGGTRSRSGTLENSLKLGLLGTAIEAQKMNYYQEGAQARKLFVVPIVFNYHFVLEAPFLIRDYLASQNVHISKRGRKNKQLLTHSYNFLKLIKKFATKSSTIAVSVGKPMDVLGNYVNEKGVSYDQAGNLINPYEILMKSVQGADENGQSLKEYTRGLAQCVLSSYQRDNYVLSSYILAFTVFRLVIMNHPTQSEKELLSLKDKHVVIYAALEKSLEEVRQAILKLEKQSRIRVSALVRVGIPSVIIQNGLSNLGLYHPQLPLIKDHDGNIIVNDITTLFFYHNRLTGYGLEQYVT